MDENWTMAAHEMVAYFGREATAVAARRAADLARCGDWPAADRAMQMLTRVERLNQERGAGHA
jgi:hypothetical protein